MQPSPCPRTRRARAARDPPSRGCRERANRQSPGEKEAKRKASASLMMGEQSFGLSFSPSVESEQEKMKLLAGGVGVFSPLSLSSEPPPFTGSSFFPSFSSNSRLISAMQSAFASARGGSCCSRGRAVTRGTEKQIIFFSGIRRRPTATTTPLALVARVHQFEKKNSSLFLVPSSPSLYPSPLTSSSSRALIIVFSFVRAAPREERLGGEAKGKRNPGWNSQQKTGGGGCTELTGSGGGGARRRQMATG